jgi:hypothetical protein
MDGDGLKVGDGDIVGVGLTVAVAVGDAVIVGDGVNVGVVAGVVAPGVRVGVGEAAGIMVTIIWDISGIFALNIVEMFSTQAGSTRSMTEMRIASNFLALNVERRCFI